MEKPFDIVGPIYFDESDSVDPCQLSEFQMPGIKVYEEDQCDMDVPRKVEGKVLKKGEDVVYILIVFI